MPIFGLTNAPESFLKLGQIRKGDKDENGNLRDLDYFRVTFLPWRMKDGQDGAALLEARFREVYGPRPTEINIRLAYPEIRKVWDANFECYKKGGLFASARTDESGAHWIFRRDDTTNEVIIRDGLAQNDDGVRILSHPLDVNAPLYSYKSRKGETVQVGFGPVGRLKVVIRELADLAVGFFEFRPESPRDIRNVSAELASFDMFARQAGKDISGVPFILRRREEQVPKRIGSQLTRGSSWVVHIDLGGEWANKALQVIEHKALPEVIEGDVRDVTQNSPDWEESPEFQEVESDDIVEPVHPEPQAKPKLKPREADIPVISARFLVDEGIVKTRKEAEYLISLLLIEGAEVEAGKKRIALFNQWRVLNPRKDDATRRFCAEKAIAGEIPPEPVKESERPF